MSNVNLYVNKHVCVHVCIKWENFCIYLPFLISRRSFECWLCISFLSSLLRYFKSSSVLYKAIWGLLLLCSIPGQSQKITEGKGFMFERWSSSINILLVGLRFVPPFHMKGVLGIFKVFSLVSNIEKLSEIFQNVHNSPWFLFWLDSSKVSWFSINFKQILATKETGTTSKRSLDWSFPF